MKTGKINGSIGDWLFSKFAYVFAAAFALACFAPFWLVFINSFASEIDIQTKGYRFFFSKLTLASYDYIFTGGKIFSSYAITIFVTVIGTSLAVLITASYAYVLSHKKVKYGNFLSFMTYFTMIFGSGIVGFYLMVGTWLHLKDTIWALILPYMLNPFFAFILVSFYRTLPYEVYESATVDGANDIHIFFKIILPMSKPALATVVLFYALQYWNDWYLALLFIDNDKMHPLQMMIRTLMSNMEARAYLGAKIDNSVVLPSEGVKLATVCMTIGPIVLLYPIIQKYFVTGITLGAVKG